MPRKKLYLISLLFIGCLFLGKTHLGYSLSYRLGLIKTPSHTSVTIEGALLISNENQTEHRFYLKDGVTFPLKTFFKGPLGGIVEKVFLTPQQIQDFQIKEGVIESKETKPLLLTHLPQRCSRLRAPKSILSLTNKKGRKVKRISEHNPRGVPRGERAISNRLTAGSFNWIYDGRLDRLNQAPGAQFFDPDAKTKNQYKIYTDMDGKNVLLLKRVKITYDYEDNSILDYEGPHPITGEPHKVYEGDGGFYANFHYAIIPYDKRVKTWDRQQILHMAQGKLSEIESEHLRPELRAHSFIPGPFLSRPGAIYDLCEWGDTAHQAPVQELDYMEMALWDWDYPAHPRDHVLLIVWEGDEEDWLIQQELIHPFHLTDDLVGIFEIRKKQTIKPLTLVNERKDFEITVQTGDLKELMR